MSYQRGSSNDGGDIRGPREVPGELAVGKRTLTQQLRPRPPSSVPEGAPVQRAVTPHRAAGIGETSDVAQQGVSAAGQQLPYMEAIQRSFGSHYVSGMRGRLGGAAARVSAGTGGASLEDSPERPGTGDLDTRPGGPDAGPAALASPGSPLNGSRDGSAPRPNNTGLPENLKSGIERLSGMSMDDVRVHYNSSRPAQLNALAYAQGRDIHVGPGQEQALPHEAWHVVQQAQGRVKPTMQLKAGVPVNADQGLEHEADAMGAKALQTRGPEAPRAEPGRDAELTVQRAGGTGAASEVKQAPEAVRDTMAGPQIGHAVQLVVQRAGGDVASDATTSAESTAIAGDPGAVPAAATTAEAGSECHTSVASFIGSKAVKLSPDGRTQAVLDAVYKYFHKDDKVIGGWLSSEDQFWKINWHIEAMLTRIGEAKKVVAAEWKASGSRPADPASYHARLDGVVAKLTTVKSPVEGFFYSASLGHPADAATSPEQLKLRYSVMDAQKDVLKGIFDSMKPWGYFDEAGNSGSYQMVELNGSANPEKAYKLAYANVLAPSNTNRHGTGAALDIQGGKSTDGTDSNARVVAAASKAGASSPPYDEVNHVHCEFFGIQGSSGGAE